MTHAEFDYFVGVDWSGAKTPKKSHAIALAQCEVNAHQAPTAKPQKLSREDIYDLITDLIKGKHRALIGIDCNFGYNYGVGQQQFGTNASYHNLWQCVDEVNKHHANFFAGDFWRSVFAEYFWTQGKQPDWFCAETLRRTTEHHAKAQGFGIPESPFKLIGAKQVGKGGLAGMRMLTKLKEYFADEVAVWPFETDRIHKAPIVITEIYPRLFIRRAGFGNAKIRNLDALNDVLAHFDCQPISPTYELNDHLTDAIIASAGLRWFHQHRQPLATESLPHEAKMFEGWIFGVSPPASEASQ